MPPRLPPYRPQLTMTILRWSALAAAVALLLFLALSRSTDPADDTEVVRGRAEEPRTEAPPDGLAEVERVLDERTARRERDRAEEQLAAESVRVERSGTQIVVERTGPAAEHPEAVLGELFAVYGSDTPGRASRDPVVPLPDGSGRWVFTGIEPGTVRWVGLRAPRFVDALVPVPAVRAGEEVTVELPIARGVAAIGRVVDLRGEPVPEARVHLGSWEQRDMSNSIGFDESVRSDEDGRFEVGGVWPGDATLRVWHRDHTFASISLGTLAEGDVARDVEVVLGDGGTVAGVVVWPDGTPAKKATVRLVSHGRNWSGAREAKSDAEGAFEFTGLTGGPFRLAAGARRRGTQGRAAAVVDVGRPVTLELGPGATLRGRVVDDRGEGVARFTVRPTPVGLDDGGSSDAVRIRRGDGSFELVGAELGAYDLSVKAKGYAPRLPVRVELGDEPTDVELVVDRLATVSCEVVDASGEPLAATPVRVGGVATKTDAEGRVGPIDVPPGTLAVTLRGFAPGIVESEAVELAPGEVRDDLVVVVGRGATVRCRLHPSLEGGIHDGATLRIENEFRMATLPFDADGVATFTGLKPGRYWASLPTVAGREWVDSHRDTAPVPLDVPAGGTVDVVVGDPGAYPIRVTGRVTRGGIAQPALLIYVYGTGDERNYPAAIGRTGDDGAYEVPLREPGTYTFNAGEGQMAQARFVVEVSDAAEQRHDLDLPDRELTGRAVRPDGTPVAGEMYVLVHASAPADTRQAGDLQFARTLGDGTFRFTGLHPGRYRLHTGNYFEPHATDGLVLVEDVVVPEEGPADPVEVVIPPAAVVTIIARDRAGRALPEHAVHLVRGDGVPHLFYDSDRTDSAGRRRLVGVGPGRWRAEVRDAGGKVIGSAELDVVAGARVERVVECG
ncbi:MAG: carboxypeptidase-like regulatory domain-containing protein [Planctomycetota bacterium]